MSVCFLCLSDKETSPMWSILFKSDFNKFPICWYLVCCEMLISFVYFPDGLPSLFYLFLASLSFREVSTYSAIWVRDFLARLAWQKSSTHFYVGEITFFGSHLTSEITLWKDFPVIRVWTPHDFILAFLCHWISSLGEMWPKGHFLF